MRSRPRFLVAIAAALAAATAVGCGDAPDNSSGLGADRFFGINGDLVFNLVIAGELALADRHLDGIEGLGVSFVRSQADWRRVEPMRPGGDADRDFAITDAWVARLAQRGLRWQLLGNGRPTPAWAASAAEYRVCGSQAVPDDPRMFARYLAALARRYGNGGSFWREHPELPELPVTTYEVWNEPNHPAFWCPRPDPEAYAELLVHAARAVRRVDPGATILFGGLAAFNESRPRGDGKVGYASFLDAALSSLPAEETPVDAVAVHPYGETPEVVMAQLEGFRSAIDAAGDATWPMFVNETGWYTSGAGGWVPTPDATRAQYLGALTTAVWDAREDLGVAAFAPYSWATREGDPADPLDWFGLASPATAQPYPSALAYAAALRSAQEDPDE